MQSFWPYFDNSNIYAKIKPNVTALSIPFPVEFWVRQFKIELVKYLCCC
ncbi:hypothetical protein EYZ11_009979 [Aspergillus tanneri]|uniref:Uncharacterized protein n=1 Tax=Aspergillus tanneri TaxID=1220188 RepID=A0A4S3J8L9_9EURO|nr:hypothetical protein EYZ11_009979 [Aspergillus tanneri]